MTQYTIKTHEKEADRILNGEQPFVIRSRKEYFFKGDKITFLMIKDGKPVWHKIGGKTYEVTTVLDHENAPIERGYRLVAFREIA